MSEAVVVSAVRGSREKELFLKLPWKFYRGNPAWVPPMLFDVRKQTDPKRGEFFQTLAGRVFFGTARARDRRPHRGDA